MKTGIHPTYHDDATMTCVCGATFKSGSTKKEGKTELCSQCHPFFTGKQKLVDSTGQVDKFLKRVKKAQEHQAKNVQEVEKDKVEEVAKETAKPAEETPTEEATVEEEAKVEEEAPAEEEETDSK